MDRYTSEQRKGQNALAPPLPSARQATRCTNEKGKGVPNKGKGVPNCREIVFCILSPFVYLNSFLLVSCLSFVLSFVVSFGVVWSVSCLVLSCLSLSRLVWSGVVWSVSGLVLSCLVSCLFSSVFYLCLLSLPLYSLTVFIPMSYCPFMIDILSYCLVLVALCFCSCLVVFMSHCSLLLLLVLSRNPHTQAYRSPHTWSHLGRQSAYWSNPPPLPYAISPSLLFLFFCYLLVFLVLCSLVFSCILLRCVVLCYVLILSYLVLNLKGHHLVRDICVPSRDAPHRTLVVCWFYAHRFPL
jgi:hypothetical protein